MNKTEIFKRALRGHGDSFYELIEPIKDSLYKIAFLHLKNEEDALDCIHESIIKAINSLHSLNNPEYFNTWMTRITINTCKDYIRKNRKVILLDIKDYENKIVSKEDNIEELETIEEALSNLSHSERDLITLRYLEDMSLKEIATRKAVPLGTIKSRLSRSLKKLRLYMEDM